MNSEDIAVKLQDHDNRIKVSEHRLKNLEEQQNQIQELALSVQKLAISVQNMVEEQKDQSMRLKTLENKGNRNWERIGNKFIEVVISITASALVVGLIYMIAQNIK